MVRGEFDGDFHPMGSVPKTANKKSPTKQILTPEDYMEYNHGGLEDHFPF